MRAARVRAAGVIECVEVPEPQPAPGQVPGHTSFREALDLITTGRIEMALLVPAALGTLRLDPILRRGEEKWAG